MGISQVGFSSQVNSINNTKGTQNYVKYQDIADSVELKNSSIQFGIDNNLRMPKISDEELKIANETGILPNNKKLAFVPATVVTEWVPDPTGQMMALPMPKEIPAHYTLVNADSIKEDKPLKTSDVLNQFYEISKSNNHELTIFDKLPDDVQLVNTDKYTYVTDKNTTSEDLKTKEKKNLTFKAVCLSALAAFTIWVLKFAHK